MPLPSQIVHGLGGRRHRRVWSHHTSRRSRHETSAHLLGRGHGGGVCVCACVCVCVCGRVHGCLSPARDIYPMPDFEFVITCIQVRIIASQMCYCTALGAHISQTYTTNHLCCRGIRLHATMQLHPQFCHKRQENGNGHKATGSKLRNTGCTYRVGRVYI